ncbi:MAG: hypothetical protein ACFFEF_04405 [Candidatus Thorarchaeota archaeon]
MERKEKAKAAALSGLIVFIGSMLFLLPIPGFYLLSLILMFIGVVLIGMGGAILKGFDKSMDVPEEECYHCKGRGKTEDGAICPRCGGTGTARPDDYQ